MTDLEQELIGCMTAFLEGSEGMSEASVTLFDSLAIAFFDADNSIMYTIISMIVSILPVALTVAGALLVVKLGWRLFRNFTRG